MSIFGKGGVQVGERAPDFELTDHEGNFLRLSEYRGKKKVVLYFYPKDETPACTVEACAFRDSFEDFSDAGAEVIGVSSDSVDSHRRFAGKHKLPFRLLADEGGALRKRYGVPKTFGLLDGRVTYVIDEQGFVRHVFSSAVRAHKHVQEALRVMRAI